MKKKNFRQCVLLLTMLTFLIMNASGQEREGSKKSQKVKGTSIRMTPPRNFEQSEDFDGFVQETTGVSIVLFETLDIAHSIYVKSLDEDYFASQQLVLEDLEVIESEGQKEYLFKCYTEVEGFKLYRLFFVTGDYNHTVIAVTNILKEVYDEVYPEVFESLMTIKGNQ